MREEQKKNISILSLVVVVLSLMLAPVIFGSYGVYAGYGYGYVACTANDVSGLNAKRLTKSNLKNKIALRWNQTSFTGCESGDQLDYYEVQLRRINGALVQEWTGITTERKRISIQDLQRNRSYKFKVRAVATDGETTSWSLYKSFRTSPKRPNEINVSNKKTNSVYASWKNVKRSRLLTHYKVVVKKKNKVVFSKNVKKGLRKDKTGVTITGLKGDSRYKLKVRSVYSRKYRSNFKRRYFRTLAESLI
ncbi:MAG: fibronectin type III domain-containing protein [bacterium]|nr:fibronectin type III domain-containing protein [bacterium]